MVCGGLFFQLPCDIRMMKPERIYDECVDPLVPRRHFPKIG